MKEQISNVIEYIKKQPVKGVITGSCLLGYFPDSKQDVDVFLYDEKSFNKLIFALHHNSSFQILDKLEKWKFEKYINEDNSSFKKLGLITLKFTYNTCVEVNVIYKKKCTDIFSVLSSFDMNIISNGLDIQTGQYLDLSGDSKETKIVDWNRWNTSFYSGEIWQLSRVLRQIDRVFKYEKRGYSCDKMIFKYIELIDKLEEYENIFTSEEFNERLVILKKNIAIVKEICNLWLKTHEISDEGLILLQQKIREI